MQTTKLISTISFNSPEFLQGKLCDLVSQGVIEYAHWIFHEPEEDELKAHAHIVLKPNRRLDTSALANEFKESVPGEKLSRGILPFKPSKMRDWVLYAVHDLAYLLTKNQTRKLHYDKAAILSTEPDLLEEDWREAHEGEDTRMRQVIELAENGVSFHDMLKMGLIPINHMFQYREVVDQFFNPSTSRAGREGHDDQV